MRAESYVIMEDEMRTSLKRCCTLIYTELLFITCISPAKVGKPITIPR